MNLRLTLRREVTILYSLLVMVGAGAPAALSASPAAPDRAAAAKPEWGVPDGPVRVRACAAKRTWRADETPELRVDLTNSRGGLTLRNFPACEVEVDGIWYVSAIPPLVAGASVLPQGSTREGIADVRLDRGRWRLKSDPKQPLELALGRHTVRVACEVDAFRPVSNAVEITTGALE